MKNSYYKVLVVAFVVAACGPQDKAAELEKLKKEQNEITARINVLEQELKGAGDETANQRAAVVQLSTVESVPFVHYLKVQGRVDSDKNVLLSARSSGTIIKVYVSEGQQVKKGQILAQIDASILESSRTELQTSLDLANNIFERQQKLWDQKIGTEVQYLQAKNNKESLESKLASLQEQIQLTKIIAPFAGSIDKIHIREGEVAAPGAPAIRIVNPSDFKITAEIAENYISRIQKGNNAIVQIPDLKATINSKVITVSRVINPTNRTFSVEVKLPDSLNQHVKANMISYLNIEDYRNEDAVVVPIKAVQQSEAEGNYVFVAENNRATLRPVKLGQTYQNNAEIISGLQAGEQIIISGQQGLVDEQLIAFSQ
ncbi:MAG: efflux RND transporter periplasmic adaptor subunit [Bacteroidota bacterium]|nr:efflux RND transporter periplasmic adaptor subunit [Bacteroidota bacterium]